MCLAANLSPVGTAVRGLGCSCSCVLCLPLSKRYFRTPRSLMRGPLSHSHVGPASVAFSGLSRGGHGPKECQLHPGPGEGTRSTSCFSLPSALLRSAWAGTEWGTAMPAPSSCGRKQSAGVVLCTQRVFAFPGTCLQMSQVGVVAGKRRVLDQAQELRC